MNNTEKKSVNMDTWMKFIDAFVDGIFIVSSNITKCITPMKPIAVPVKSIRYYAALRNFKVKA